MQESDKLLAELTRYCGESLVATSAVFYGVHLTWKYTRRSIEATFKETGPDFSSANGALCVVKAMQESDKLHADLNRHCGKPFIETNAVPHGV